jgi:hypothetical protein
MLDGRACVFWAMRLRDLEDWDGFLLHVANRREPSPGRSGKRLLDTWLAWQGLIGITCVALEKKILRETS